MITLKPIAVAYNERKEIKDDDWGRIFTKIVLEDSLPNESITGIDAFSHLDIIYHFHMVDEDRIITAARHPRNNSSFPKVGIFGQRGKNRPNRLGLTTVKLVKKEERSLIVQGLDCVDGTPILDIKPVMKEFLPTEPIIQPEWSHEVMSKYWQ